MRREPAPDEVCQRVKAEEQEKPGYYEHPRYADQYTSVVKRHETPSKRRVPQDGLCGFRVKSTVCRSANGELESAEGCCDRRQARGSCSRENIALLRRPPEIVNCVDDEPSQH